MFGMLPFERKNNDNLFDLFDDFFTKNSAALPDFRTDIKESGDNYILEAELPGFNKEDISLEVKDGVLTSDVSASGGTCAASPDSTPVSPTIPPTTSTARDRSAAATTSSTTP